MNKYLYILSLLILAGCATTAINSSPQGAKVYIRGDYAGVTPLAVDLTGFWGERSALIRCEYNGQAQERMIVKGSTIHSNYTTGSIGESTSWPPEIHFNFSGR